MTSRKIAPELLANEWGVGSEIFSVTSFSELAREAAETQRYNRLHPAEPPRSSHVERQLAGGQPIIAASDYVRAYPQLIAPYLDGRFVALGTDGFGRSDTRSALRRFFEVDRYSVVLATLHELARTGAVAKEVPAEAIRRYAIATDRPAPWNC
jgi:pyruvate dehydrogenase E1 component